MAGHLPVQTNRYHKAIIKRAFDLGIQKQKPFERIHSLQGFYQLLTKEYEMSCEHGKVDELIFAFTPKKMDKIYEYHFDKNGKINEIYLVM
jgi:hypothetical protein